MADRARAQTFRGLIQTAAALIACAVVATALTIVGLHGDATEDAERDTGNIATLLAAQTTRLVQAIDLTLVELQSRVASSGVTTPAALRAAFSGEDTFRFLRGQLARLSEADAVTLIGGDGVIVNHSREFPARALDLTDRDYFIRARQGVADLLVGAVTSRYTGR